MPSPLANLSPRALASPTSKQHVGVDLAREVLAGPAAGQRQQVDVGPQVAGRADLPAGQERLQRHRAAERQADVRIGCVGQREVHHLGDEAGHMK